MSNERPQPVGRTLSVVVFLFVTVFLGATAVRQMAANAFGTYRIFGFYSPSNDFYLYRYLVFAAVPFGFNLCFGLYFALRFHARRPNGERRAWGALLAFVTWVLVFNIPLFLTGPLLSWPPGFEWPPESLYIPVYAELVLFIPMGNLGALLGFAAGGLAGHVRSGI